MARMRASPGVFVIAMLASLVAATWAAAADPAWLLQARERVGRDPQGAIALADSAAAAAQQIGDRRAAYVAHKGRAELYRRLGQYGEAVLDAERALADAEAVGEPDVIADAQLGLGVAFSLSGLYSDALQAFQQALLLLQESGNWERASAALTNIGNVLAESDDNAAARDYYERALAMKREHGIRRGLGIVLNNLGDLDRETGNLDSAKQLLGEAIEQHQAAGEHGSESIARTNLALVLSRLGEFQAALHQIEVAEQRAAGAGVRELAAAVSGRAETYLRMARAEAGLGNLRQQRLQRAVDAVERARQLVADMDDPSRQAAVAELASEIHAELDDPARALALLREAGEYRREHDRRANLDRQAVLAAKFMDAQQRGEIAELRERELRQRAELQEQRGFALLLGVGTLAMAIGAALLLRHVRERRHHAAELTARNVALGDALLEAEEQHQRAGQLAGLNRRLLALAGDDLRGPLLQIRSLSERLLVERRGDPALERRIAAIAQASSQLMRLADQITDSAALVSGPEDGRAPSCNVLALLREQIDQVDVRFLGRERRLQLAGDARARVRVDARRLDRVLHELIDAVLQHNPGNRRLGIDLQRSGNWVELRIDDPSTDVLRRLGSGGGSVGLAFARGVIRELGGELDAEPLAETPRLLMKLPAA